MAKLSVAIAAHPNRKHLVRKLLDGPLWGHPIQVAWDQKDDIWDTHQRAWELARDDDPEADFALVLQDDAVCCKHLIPGLEMALGFIPTAPVSLYFGNAQNHPKIARAARTATEKKVSWIVSSGFWWGVAALLPKQLIDPMLKFCTPRREPNYDRRLSIWTEHEELPVYYPWPSLVDHLDEPSLAHAGRKSGRKAYQFVGEDFSALAFPADTDAVQCGRIPGQMVKLGPKKGA